MREVRVNFSECTGRVKPMHAVNNGPVYKFAADQRITNMDAYKAAGIPYARNHDASFLSTYGGEHTVDVNFIFPDFDKDPYDPENYDFLLTDEYIKVTEYAVTKTFYRLGTKIEHWPKKYNIIPPKDFKKWAVICEHIIRHYTEGWADGFNYDIEYWEIWNEPDLWSDETHPSPTWAGTEEQFFEFYDVAATHLKNCFPHLKIGGPAAAGNLQWCDRFLAQLKAPLDFFSWHRYAYEPEFITKNMREFREMLDKHGFTETESILNEWNYVKGWTGDDWLYSMRQEINMKGAAFIAAVQSEGQREALDMLMYYDARPCAMNGMFGPLACDIRKGYYPFYAFNVLYKLGKAYKTEDGNEMYAVAAKNGNEAAIIVTRFTDDDNAPDDKCIINVEGLGKVAETEVYLLDDEHDLELVRCETFTGKKFGQILNFSRNSMYLIKLKLHDDITA